MLGIHGQSHMLPKCRGREYESGTLTEQNYFSFEITFITVLIKHADILKVQTVKKISREKQKGNPKPYPFRGKHFYQLSCWSSPYVYKHREKKVNTLTQMIKWHFTLDPLCSLRDRVVPRPATPYSLQPFLWFCFPGYQWPVVNQGQEADDPPELMVRSTVA